MSNLSTLIDEGAKIRQTLPSEAMEIFKKVLSESELNSDEEYKTKSLFNIAITHLILGDYNRSISYFRQSLNTGYARADIELQSEILRGIAGNYGRKYNYKEALRYYYLSENASIQSDNRANLHMVYQGLASLYSKLHLDQKALEYTLKSLEIAVESGLNEPLQTSLMSIGACYCKLGNYPEAKKYLEESLGYKSSSFAESNALHFLSMMKFEEGNSEDAEKLALRQIEICQKNNYFDFEAVGLRQLGKISFKKENFSEALDYYNKALKVINSVGDRTVKFAVMKDIIDTHEKMGDKTNIIDHYDALYKEHVKHLQNDMQVKIEQMDLENETEMIKQEVEREKENNQRLTKALDEVSSLNDKLHLMHEEKNNLMSILAHDLKNPLQNIISSVRLMNSDEDDRHLRDEMTLNITEQSKRMFSLIKRLLDYRSIEGGNIKISLTEFTSCEISKRLIKNIRVLSAKKAITIVNECLDNELKIYSDIEILYQILENLLSNSVKFSSSGSTIYLRCKLENNRHIFEVEDHGPGFTAKDKTKLYSNFSKLSAQPTANEHTTGLGLSIVKKLCNFLGADIMLESENGNGAKFTVTLKESN